MSDGDILSEGRPFITIEPDPLFEQLRSPRRRRVLRLLDEHGATELNTLSALVAAEEHKIDVEGVTPHQRKSVYVSLYQTHLPKLRDAKLVEWNEESAKVRPMDEGRHVADIIRRIDNAIFEP